MMSFSSTERPLEPTGNGIILLSLFGLQLVLGGFPTDHAGDGVHHHFAHEVARNVYACFGHRPGQVVREAANAVGTREGAGTGANVVGVCS
jgi:hypothetical protein